MAFSTFQVPVYALPPEKPYFQLLHNGCSRETVHDDGKQYGKPSYRPKLVPFRE